MEVQNLKTSRSSSRLFQRSRDPTSGMKPSASASSVLTDTYSNTEKKEITVLKARVSHDVVSVPDSDSSPHLVDENRPSFSETDQSDASDAFKASRGGGRKSSLTPSGTEPLKKSHGRSSSTPNVPQLKASNRSSKVPNLSAFEAKFERPISDLSIPKDLPRFILKLLIRDNRTPIWPDEAINKTAVIMPRIESAIAAILRITGETSNDIKLLTDQKSDVETVLTKFVNRISPSSLFGTVMRAAFFQGIVSPFWIWLKMSVLEEFPFRDVPFGWHVEITNTSSQIHVTHMKQEQSRTASADDADDPAFSFQWNLCLIIDKASRKLVDVHYWISQYSYKTGTSFSIEQAEMLTSIIKKLTNATRQESLDLPINIPGALELKKCFLYQGPVQYKVGKNFVNSWMQFTEQTTFLTVYNINPELDHLGCRPLVYFDVRNASVTSKSTGDDLFLCITTQKQKDHKFHFDSAEAAIQFLGAIDACIEFADKAEQAITHIMKAGLWNHVDHVDRNRSSSTSSGTASSKSPKVEILSPSKGQPSPQKSLNALIPKFLKDSSPGSSSPNLKDRLSNERMSNESSGGRQSKGTSPRSNSTSTDRHDRSPSFKKRAKSIGSSSSNLNKQKIAAISVGARPSQVSSSKSVGKLLQVRSEIKQKESQVLEFPILDSRGHQTSLREMTKKRLVAVYALRDYGNLTAQFAILELLKRDIKFLHHRGIHVAVLGPGCYKIFGEEKGAFSVVPIENFYMDQSATVVSYLCARSGFKHDQDTLCAGVFFLNEAVEIAYAIPISIYMNLPKTEEVNKFVHGNPKTKWSQVSSPLFDWSDLAQANQRMKKMISAPSTKFTCELGSKVAYEAPLKIVEEVFLYDQGVSNHVVPSAVASGKRSDIVSHLVQVIISGAHDRIAHPDLLESKLRFKKIDDIEFNETLINIQRKGASNEFKVGFLVAESKQCSEEEEGQLDDEVENFLEMLGEKVEVAGWKKFNAGLDAYRGLTGKHSYFTTIEDCDVMFHVGPLIQLQSLADMTRRRLIENDTVVIIYKKGHSDVFHPAEMSSVTNQIYVVVEQVPAQAKTMYRVNIANKASVPTYPPYLPENPVFESGPELRKYLLTKIINGERTAVARAQMFSEAHQKTLEGLLLKAIKDFTPKSKKH